MTIDLQDLANRPGYGTASEALRSAGAWDEYAAEGGEPRKFTAAVEAMMPCHCTVTVTARSEDEAEEKIHDMVSDPKFSGWQWDEGADDIGISIYGDTP